MIKYNELLFIITYLLPLGQIMLKECPHTLDATRTLWGINEFHQNIINKHEGGPSGGYPVVSVLDDSNFVLEINILEDQ